MRGPSELNLTKSGLDFTRSAPLPSRGRWIPVRYAKAAAPLERPKRRAKREERREQREERREHEHNNIYDSNAARIPAAPLKIDTVSLEF